MEKPGMLEGSSNSTMCEQHLKIMTGQTVCSAPDFNLQMIYWFFGKLLQAKSSLFYFANVTAPLELSLDIFLWEWRKYCINIETITHVIFKWVCFTTDSESFLLALYYQSQCDFWTFVKVAPLSFNSSILAFSSGNQTSTLKMQRSE